MSLQMCSLRIVKGLEKRAFVEGGTGIADIRRMEPCDAHFLNKVRTVVVTAAEPAEGSITVFPGTLFTAQQWWFGLTGLPVLAGIK